METINNIVKHYLTEKSYSEDKNKIEQLFYDNFNDEKQAKLAISYFFGFINNLLKQSIEIPVLNVANREINHDFVKSQNYDISKLYQFITDLFVNYKSSSLGKNYINFIKRNDKDKINYINSKIVNLWKGYIFVIIAIEIVNKLLRTDKYKDWLNNYINSNAVDLEPEISFINVNDYFNQYYTLYKEFVDNFRVIKTNTEENEDVIQLINNTISLANENGDIIYNDGHDIAINLNTFNKAEKYCYDICYNMNGENDNAVWCIAKSPEKFNEYYEGEKQLLLMVLLKDGENYIPYLMCVYKNGIVKLADIRNKEEKTTVLKLTPTFSDGLIEFLRDNFINDYYKTR